MGERPRIVKQITEQIVDPHAYTQNSCSPNARKFHEYSSDLVVEIWIDKHCTLRQVERSGIDIDTLQNLAIESVKHIIYYQLRLQKFNIVQYPEHRGRDKRVLVQETKDDGVLNLILEYHYLDLCRYEVTMITAMVDDNFGIFDGQYILHIDGESSILRRKIVGAIGDVSSFGI